MPRVRRARPPNRIAADCADWAAGTPPAHAAGRARARPPRSPRRRRRSAPRGRAPIAISPLPPPSPPPVNQPNRHAGPCAKRPRISEKAAWMAGTSPAMTRAAFHTESRCAQNLFPLDDLRGKPLVGLAADALEIVEQHRLAVGRRLRDPHVSRDDRLIDFF